MLLSAGRLFAALVLAGCGIVLGELPAHACSCVVAGPQVHAKAATDVFTGQIVKATGPRTGTGHRSYLVEVERVYKGDLATAEVRVRTRSSEGVCGLPNLPAERRYLFFTEGLAHRIDACGGTAPASADLMKRIERVLGSGRPPVAAPAEQAVFTQVGDTEPSSAVRVAAPGIALVVIGLIGLAVVRLAARRSGSPR